MQHYRIEAAKAMGGCCIFVALGTWAITGWLGLAPTADQFGLIMMITAMAAAAWLAEPRQKS